MRPFPYIICLVTILVTGFTNPSLMPALLIATVCADQICEAIKSNSDKDGKL